MYRTGKNFSMACLADSVRAVRVFPATYMVGKTLYHSRSCSFCLEVPVKSDSCFDHLLCQAGFRCNFGLVDLVSKRVLPLCPDTRSRNGGITTLVLPGTCSCTSGPVRTTWSYYRHAWLCGVRHGLSSSTQSTPLAGKRMRGRSASLSLALLPLEGVSSPTGV